MKKISACFLGLFFMTAGTLHFVNPGPFVDIVPVYLPHPLGLVWVSGFFEILGGLGLFIPIVRRWAGYGLILLLLAVFPANIFMATDHPYILGKLIPSWILIVRLPAQFLLMAWVYWAASKPKESG